MNLFYMMVIIIRKVNKCDDVGCGTNLYSENLRYLWLRRKPVATSNYILLSIDLSLLKHHHFFNELL